MIQVDDAGDGLTGNHDDFVMTLEGEPIARVRNLPELACTKPVSEKTRSRSNRTGSAWTNTGQVERPTVETSPDFPLRRQPVFHGEGCTQVLAQGDRGVPGIV